jgi:hypothetical protein
MKKWLLMVAAVGLLSACSSEEATVTKEELIAALAEEEPTQEELNAALKEEAEPAVFNELNVNEPPVDKRVTATGEVSAVTDPGLFGQFTLATEEDGGAGMYTIMNISNTEVQDGMTVTIYGIVTEKADDGTTVINAMIIE